MRFTNSWGISIDNVKNKQYNIWIGISFSNKKFTDSYVKELLDTAVMYTEKHVLVWLPGRMHATNYYYFDKLSRAESLQRAYEDERRMCDMLEYYILEKRYENISMVAYDDVLTQDFVRRKDILFRAFAEQEEFYDGVCDIAQGFLKTRNRPIEKKRIEFVALYILQELPAMIGGLQTFDSDIHYSVLFYPGIDKLDILAQDLIEGKKYKELSEKLKVKGVVGVVDVSLV